MYFKLYDSQVRDVSMFAVDPRKASVKTSCHFALTDGHLEIARLEAVVIIPSTGDMAASAVDSPSNGAYYGDLEVEVKSENGSYFRVCRHLAVVAYCTRADVAFTNYCFFSLSLLNHLQAFIVDIFENEVVVAYENEYVCHVVIINSLLFQRRNLNRSIKIYIFNFLKILNSSHCLSSCRWTPRCKVPLADVRLPDVQHCTSLRVGDDAEVNILVCKSV